MARNDSEASMPAVGDRIFYRLRTNSDLIAATVITSWTDDHDETTRLRHPKHGTLHLEVELDPDRHFSSGDRGLRLNVEEGDAPGQWQRTKPSGEDKAQADREYRKQVETELNRERAIKTARKV